MRTDSITIQAHAKVNLALAVDHAIERGPHAGMHPICSWMAPVGLADTIEIERLEEGLSATFDIRWAETDRPVEWPSESDLTVRAHRAIEAEHNRTLPVRLRCRKHIPAGGGLGGGSADAAAALRGIDALFQLRTAEADLHRLAATLGSDIPFFIDAVRTPDHAPRPAIVSGLGDRIERLASAPSGELTLIFPPFGCPTGAVYRAFDSDPPPTFRENAVRAAANATVPNDADLLNDLMPAAVRTEPRLAEIRDLAASLAGRPAHLSGSGSTLFLLGPLPDREAFESRLVGHFPGTRVVETRFAH